MCFNVKWDEGYSKHAHITVFHTSHITYIQQILKAEHPKHPKKNYAKENREIVYAVDDTIL